MVNPVPGAGEPEGGGVAALAAVAAQAADVPVLVSDPRQEGSPFVWVNAALTLVTGWSAADARGLSWDALAGEGTDPVSLAELRRGLAAHEPVRVVLRGVRRQDGGVAWDELTVTPVLDERGEVVHDVGVLRDVTARVDAERRARTARARLAVLDDVSEALAVDEVARVVDRLVEVLARSVPWAAVVLADGGLRLVAVSGAAAPVAPGGRGLPPRPLPSSAAAGTDPLAALLTGRSRAPVTVRLETPAEGTEVPGADDLPAVGDWLAAALAAAGVPTGAGDRSDGTAVVVPVPGRDRPDGLLVLGGRGPADGARAGLGDDLGGDDPVDSDPLDSELDDDDHGLAVEVARRLGPALGAARLHEQQRLLAETLQHVLMPALPSVPGLDVWSYHQRPDGDRAQVGGCWSDVLQPGGEGSGVVVGVVGDVGGQDVESAAATGRLRSVLRASAHEQEEPGTVLARVDQLVTGMRVRRAAALVHARLEDLGDGAWEMSWSCAGHPPPVLVRAGRARPLEGGDGVALGVGDRPRPTGLVDLGPGDAVVLCTDGLVGRRAPSSGEGVDALVAACTEAAGVDAAGTGEHLLEALGDAPEGDRAVLVLRVPGVAPLPGPRRRRWQLPGEASSVARARRRAAAVGALWGLPTTAQAELVVSELVANAVLHGWGTVGLRLVHDDEGLLVEVDDSNPAPPGVVVGRREGPGGYGLHVVQRLSRWGWRPGDGGKTVWARLPDAG